MSFSSVKRHGSDMSSAFVSVQDAMYLDKQTYRRNRLYDFLFIRASTQCREAFNE